MANPSPKQCQPRSSFRAAGSRSAQAGGLCYPAAAALLRVYYKASPAQDLMGLLFGFTQGQVSDWVRRLTAAGRRLPLHKPARAARDLRALLAREPALREVIIDGTERRLPRPTHAGRQPCYYCGRKKRHTVKNVIITAQGRVRRGSRTVPGRRQDQAVTEKERLRLPKEITVLADSGFAGLEPGAATPVTPWKKPKGRKLHWQRRAFNPNAEVEFRRSPNDRGAHAARVRSPFHFGVRVQPALGAGASESGAHAGQREAVAHPAG